VSFQVTILKVLAGQPEGRLSLADLRSNVAILISSGPDWADRTKRIAARDPKLDIFSQGMVVRSSGGWQITEAGRAFLSESDVLVSSQPQEAPLEAVGARTPPAALQPASLSAPNTRRRTWWSRRRPKKKAARSSAA
jgi:hypothetical protein